MTVLGSSGISGIEGRWNRQLIEIYEWWTRHHEGRETAMINGICDYSKQNPLETGDTKSSRLCSSRWESRFARHPPALQMGRILRTSSQRMELFACAREKPRCGNPVNQGLKLIRSSVETRVTPGSARNRVAAGAAVHSRVG